jgi:ABC-type histidine transport system ATPase subunit
MMSEPTQQQIQNHTKAVQVTADDFAARVGFLTLQQEKIMGQLNMHLSNFNESQAEVIRLTAENNVLKAQVKTLQAAQGDANKTSDATASPNIAV